MRDIKVIIPLQNMRERLLPYAEMFRQAEISEDMIYNVACYTLQTCIENKNFTEEFVRDKADLTAWEIFSETACETFGDDKSYRELEGCIQMAVIATTEASLEMASFIKNFDNQLLDYAIALDGYIVPEEDKYDNLILDFTRSGNDDIQLSL
jgi:hypothetical protein